MKEVERQETAWLRLAWQLGYEEGRPRAPVGRGEARALPEDRGRAGAPQDRRHRHDRDLHDPAVLRDYLARLMKMLPVHVPCGDRAKTAESTARIQASLCGRPARIAKPAPQMGSARSPGARVCVYPHQVVAPRRRRRGSCRCCAAVNFGSVPDFGDQCCHEEGDQRQVTEIRLHHRPPTIHYCITADSSG